MGIVNYLVTHRSKKPWIHISELPVSSEESLSLMSGIGYCMAPTDIFEIPAKA